jgi:hypothetical protein
MAANRNRFALLADDDCGTPRLPQVTRPAKAEDPPRFPAEVPKYSVESIEDIRDRVEDLHLEVYYRRRWDKRVGKSLFLKHRHIPRNNVPDNPTDVTNPFYVEMIKTGWVAWEVQTHFLGESDVDFDSTLPSQKGWEHPVWSFHRAGRTRTVLPASVTTDSYGVLPAGTKLFIGGYHGEDWIDEDFVIYHDVTIVKPDGTIHVLQYPLADFPPTDFHTATLIDQEVYIIGSAGYMDHRGDRAQVCVLDLRTLSVHSVITTGDDPGWICKHEVVDVQLNPGQITIRIPVPISTALEDGCFPGRWSFDTLKSRWSAVAPDDFDIAAENLYRTNLSTQKYDEEYQRKVSREKHQRRKSEIKKWKSDWKVKVHGLVSSMEANLATFDAQEKEAEKSEEIWEEVLKKEKSGVARDKLVIVRELLDRVRTLQEETRAKLDKWRPCLRYGDTSSDSDSDTDSGSVV